MPQEVCALPLQYGAQQPGRLERQGIRRWKTKKPLK